MKPEYIQLPPLPSDLPAEVIEMIWLYTRLSVEEQEMIREFIRENLKKRNRNVKETDFAKVLQDSEAEENPDVKEFIDLMRKLIGILIAQSCEMAALVYQNYCMEKNLRKKYQKSQDPNFCSRFIFHPGQILVGECLPQTLLMKKS